MFHVREWLLTFPRGKPHPYSRPCPRENESGSGDCLSWLKCGPAACSLRFMEAMHRIICSKLLVLIRLAIIVSLVGYTMPNVYAAMHGTAYSGTGEVVADDHHSGSHDHGATAKIADAGHHAADADDGDPGKQFKKNCCQDFCFSVALPSHCQDFLTLAASATLRFFDDTRVHGTRPSLHRPPNI